MTKEQMQLQRKIDKQIRRTHMSKEEKKTRRKKLRLLTGCPSRGQVKSNKVMEER